MTELELEVRVRPPALPRPCASCGCTIRAGAELCTSCARPTLVEHDERGTTNERD